MKRGSKYITLTQRRDIEKCIAMGMSKTDIARFIGMSLRTVYREFERGKCVQRKKVYDVYGDFVYKEYSTYSADIAQVKFDINMTAKGAPLKIGNDFELINEIENRVFNDKISPCAALGRIKHERCCHTNISKTTLYRYIRMGCIFNRLTMCNVELKTKRYQKIIIKRAPKGTSIEKRPIEILKRNSFGHWEMDCVCSKQGTISAFLVLTERLTRKELIFKITNKRAETVVACLNTLERRIGKNFNKIFKSITVDNGVEFSDFIGLEKSVFGGKRTNVYYCHPYTSCERGSNERLNREIRRLVPKGTDLTDITDKEVKAIERWVNNYPREIFGYATSDEMFEQQLKLI